MVHVETPLSLVFVQVVVHITDENDCTPEFMHSIYSRDNVPETTPPGTSLLQGESMCLVEVYEFTVTVTHKSPLEKNYFKTLSLELFHCLSRSLSLCFCLSVFIPGFLAIFSVCIPSVSFVFSQSVFVSVSLSVCFSLSVHLCFSSPSFSLSVSLYSHLSLVLFISRCLSVCSLYSSYSSVCLCRFLYF